MSTRKLISFDWALKRLLRSKANFCVLEGFLSELLRAPLTILDILESETNTEAAEDKLTRLDIKVKSENGSLLLIELQYSRELDFLHRILFNTAKAITEHLWQGDDYQRVVKVISVNILFFDLGHGKDYVYHGQTKFKGIHCHDELVLSHGQQKLFHCEKPEDIYPEYYLLKINQFEDVAKDGLDQWIYFLKYETIKPEFNAAGLIEATNILDYMKLPEAEKRLHDRHIDERRQQSSAYLSYYEDGKNEGIEEGFQEGIQKGLEEGIQKGLEEGIQKGKEDTATKLKRKGIPLDIIAETTGLSISEIQQLAD
jgi:predicted transposase/invertase (TIGR01784 family)